MFRLAADVQLPADFTNTEEKDLGEFNAYFYPEEFIPKPHESILRTTLRYARCARQSFEAYLAWQDYREVAAVSSVKNWLGEIGRNGRPRGLSRNAAGKLIVYVVFGSGHHATLTEKMRDVGLEPAVRVLNPQDIPPEHDLVIMRSAPRKQFMKEVILDSLSDQLDWAKDHAPAERIAVLQGLLEDIKAKM